MDLRRSALLLMFTVVMALPLPASQFVKLSFDRVARDATIVVRGTVGPITSSWDDSREVIYSYAMLRVDRYVAGFGPIVLPLREVGGRVGDYTQEAIGFPELREGEEVVLFLRRWDEGADWRIDAYTLGKYVVDRANGEERVRLDARTQGHARGERGGPLQREATAEEEALSIDEFQAMVTAARRARETPGNRQQID